MRTGGRHGVAPDFARSAPPLQTVSELSPQTLTPSGAPIRRSSVDPGLAGLRANWNVRVVSLGEFLVVSRSRDHIASLDDP